MKNSESKIQVINMSEDKDSEKKKRRRMPLTHSMAAKVVAFILAVISFITFSFCVVSAVLMAGTKMYSTPKSVFVREAFNLIAWDDCEDLLPRLLVLGAGYDSAEGERYARDYCEGGSIVSAEFSDPATGKTIWEYKPQGNVKHSDTVDISFVWHGTDYMSFGYETEDFELVLVDVDMIISTEYGIQDGYYLAERLINFAYSMLYNVYIVGVLALLLFVACMIFLMCSSGHRAGCDDVKAGWGTKAPLDILTALVIVLSAFCVFVFLKIADEILYYDSLSEIAAIIPIAIAFMVAIISAFLGWLMSFALRIKLGKWWKNTVVFYVLKALWSFAKFLWRQCKRLFCAIRNIPLIWKTFLSVSGITILELIIILSCWYEPDNYMSFWIIEKLVLIPVVLNCVFTMRKLHMASQALSEGDLSYQVDTEKMWGDFKSHGENLNCIAEGMTVAVDERMKSERMKTELITNVSHDIKTPLTSIINYTDLIAKEPCENVKITEYAKVLTRSSERLKRLIEDLVEASKASTGNLEVLLAPCDANILISQVAGEYGDRLREGNLELIVTQPEEPVMIMADGRRLWRVFDNLFNNICKYAQEFTRVYMSLEKSKEEVVITLKNTSRVALNISEEELMERFVRGDKSRNTEGNGLGLSIARSLTQLQDGDLSVSIDGDLFKVTLSFPAMK